MPKKNNSQGLNWMIIVIVLLLLLLPIVPVFWGIMALLKWIKWYKTKKYYPNNSISDYWLTQDEKNKFLEYRKNYFIADENLNQLRNTANAENLTRNADGSISNKSNRGKEINRLYTEQFEIYNSNKQNFDYLIEKPIYEWTGLKEIYASYIASIFAFTVWIAFFYFTLSNLFRKPILALVEVYDHFALGRNKFIYLSDDWLAKLTISLSISAIISIAVYFLAKFLTGRFIFSIKFPKPPLVNSENYNNY